MDEIGEINERKEDFLDKKYMGIVEDANDPRKEGRARIRVFGVYDDIDTKDLPWAYPKQKSTFFGKDGKGGSISIPKKNSIVGVEFNNGNIYSPEYFSIHELADDVKDELYKDGKYHGSHIILFDGDEELKIWYAIETGLTIQLKGSRINISDDKSITIEHDSSSSIIELKGGEIKIASNSTINLTSSNEIKASSNDVWLDGNAVKVGHEASQPAVLGSELMLLLTQLAGLIDLKMPTSGAAAVGIVNQYTSKVLSKSVKVAK